MPQQVQRSFKINHMMSVLIVGTAKCVPLVMVVITTARTAEEASFVLTVVSNNYSTQRGISSRKGLLSRSSVVLDAAQWSYQSGDDRKELKMATKTKKARFAGIKASLLRLAKIVGGLYALGVGMMIKTGSASTISIIATLVAGGSYAALLYAARKLDD